MTDATTDFSCGVIPWRLTPGGEREYLLIQHNAGHWSFPKGHPEAGEDDLVAARRELAEETGIEAVELLEAPPFDEHYRFQGAEGALVSKTVRYFLGQVPAEHGEVVLQVEEVQAAAWGVVAATKERLTFPEGRGLLQRAEDYLNTQVNR
jgi:8-oxo-dGTP pyrophosphatase MutT (NUDIX family)